MALGHVPATRLMVLPVCPAAHTWVGGCLFRGCFLSWTVGVIVEMCVGFSSPYFILVHTERTGTGTSRYRRVSEEYRKSNGRRIGVRREIF